MTTEATPGELGSNDQLGLLVERLREAAARKWPRECDQKHSLFGEAASAIERLQKLQRDKCAAAVRATPTHTWVDGSDQFGNPCPAKIVTTREQYAQACERA